jgi:hypothetical protein
MPVMELPNGEVVFVEDGTPPEVIARIRQEAARKGKKRTGKPQRRLSNEEREVQRRVSVRRRSAIPGMEWFDNVSQARDRGLFSNFNDELAGFASAATGGVVDAIRHGDIKRIGNEN